MNLTGNQGWVMTKRDEKYIIKRITVKSIEAIIDENGWCSNVDYIVKGSKWKIWSGDVFPTIEACAEHYSNIHQGTYEVEQ